MLGADMSSTPVSFLSDYGLADEFVGVVHGVIARIGPDVRVIDVTHQIPRGDVRAGALALLRAVQYLPDGVVLAVVDPGVGTDRRAIAAATARGFFVGPDNGLLAPAVAMVGGAHRIVSLEDSRFRLPGASATFDGRDVFAPAAAVLATAEARLEDLGPEVDPASISPLLLPLAEPGDDSVEGEVWWIDHFGNAQTNVSPADLQRIGLEEGDDLQIRIGAETYTMAWERTFGSETSQGVVFVDSAGMMALAVPGGRADDRYRLRSGLSIGFRRPTAAAR
jgi:S-adenosylmethionine hydrolase